MDWTSSDVLTVLTFLLPGFVSAATYYSLTSYGKPSEFERVVQALIFTMIVQGLLFGGLALLEVFRGVSIAVSSTIQLVSTILIGIGVGVMASYFTNYDVLHSLFRRIGITKENSYPTEWYSAFSQHGESYVVLHLTGERRLYGWPDEWPSVPGEGHFVVSQGEWLTEDGTIPAAQGSKIVVSAADVEMVEFLPQLTVPKTEIPENG